MLVIAAACSDNDSGTSPPPPPGTFVNGTDAMSEVANVTFPSAAPYTVTLTVSDDHGGQDPTQATVGAQ